LVEGEEDVEDLQRSGTRTPPSTVGFERTRESCVAPVIFTAGKILVATTAILHGGFADADRDV